MNPHPHLHTSTSSASLSNVSKNLGGSSGRSKARARLFTKISKLVRPTDSNLVSTGLKSSPSPRDARTTVTKSNISAPSLSTLAEPFRIVHECYETPMYTPSRPMRLRSNSEYEAALEDIFAHEGGGRRNLPVEKADEEEEDDEGPEKMDRAAGAKAVTRVEKRNTNLHRCAPYRAESQKQQALKSLTRAHLTIAAKPHGNKRRPPPPPLPLPPRSLATSLHCVIPPGPQTAGARLETIPASPVALASLRPLPTHTTTTNLLPRPSTARIPPSRDFFFLHAPRPLSERAMLPRDLARATTTRVTTTKQNGEPLSPLTPSPLRASETPTTMGPRPPSPSPIDPTSPGLLTTPGYDAGRSSARRRPRPRPQMSISSVRANAGAVLSSDDEEGQNDDNDDTGRPESLSPRRRMRGLERQPPSQASDGRAGHCRSGATAMPPTPPPSARCYMCPEPCKADGGGGGGGLCTACHARVQEPRQQERDNNGGGHHHHQDGRTSSSSSSSSRSSSDYEDVAVHTPTSLTTSTTTLPSSRAATNPLPAPPVTPPPTRKLHDDVHSSRNHCYYYYQQRSSHTSSSPETPVTPRGWSRLLTTSAQLDSAIRSPQPPAPEGRRGGLAMHHPLEHGIMRRQHEQQDRPLTPGATPERRGGCEEAAEADAKLAAPAAGVRRHEAGGSYGDWFSYYAEKEGAEVSGGCGAVGEDAPEYQNRRPVEEGTGMPGLSCSLPLRRSATSSIYDRIQSIYDVYAEIPAGGVEDAGEDDEVPMF